MSETERLVADPQTHLFWNPREAGARSSARVTLAVFGAFVLGGCGASEPPVAREASPEPAAEQPTPELIVLPRPVHLDLSGGPLVYRASWASSPDAEGRGGDRRVRPRDRRGARG